MTLAGFLVIVFVICISPLIKIVLVEAWKYLNGR